MGRAFPWSHLVCAGAHFLLVFTLDRYSSVQVLRAPGYGAPGFRRNPAWDREREFGFSLLDPYPPPSPARSAQAPICLLLHDSFIVLDG